MTTNGTYTAVVDRFEDELAVLLLEDNDETVDEAVVEKAQLPEDGRHVDAVLTVQFDDGDFVEATYCKDETSERAAGAQRRFDDLSQRPPSGDDDEDAQ